MDVDTFVTHPFHPQQNGKCSCCKSPIAYFYCSIESDTCFSFVSLLYLIMLWILWDLQWFCSCWCSMYSYLAPNGHGNLSVIAVLPVMHSCHIVTTCWAPVSCLVATLSLGVVLLCIVVTHVLVLLYHIVVAHVHHSNKNKTDSTINQQ